MSEKAENPRKELEGSELTGVEDNIGILCTGTIVEERSQGSGETCM